MCVFEPAATTGRTAGHNNPLIMTNNAHGTLPLTGALPSALPPLPQLMFVSLRPLNNSLSTRPHPCYCKNHAPVRTKSLETSDSLCSLRSVLPPSLLPLLHPFPPHPTAAVSAPYALPLPHPNPQGQAHLYLLCAQLDSERDPRVAGGDMGADARHDAPLADCSLLSGQRHVRQRMAG